MNKAQYYQQARKAGMTAKNALNTANTLVQWDAKNGLSVRLRAEPEEESYFATWGEPEAYTDIHGRRVSTEKAKEELCESLERDGCWIVISEYWDGQEWQQADSVGMCTGYADPCDWKQNWYVPDLMASALEHIVNAKEEKHWEATCALNLI